jgi:hypothetical protein
MGELRLKLTGDDAELGRIPARDIAQLLFLVEKAVAQAASTVVGRPKTTTGRREKVIADAVLFRLRAIEEGSVVPVLDLPERSAAAPDALELDVASLTETAVETLLNAAEGKNAHPVTVSALLDLSDGLHIGETYESVEFGYRPSRSVAARAVTVDRTVRSRLRALVKNQELKLRDDTVVGTLVEADFEKHTARLRGPFNETVYVSFDERLADDIQVALRRPASFQGKIAYDPDTRAAREVRVESISPGRQLSLGVDVDAFWIERSFDELADEQAVVPAQQADELYDTDSSEDEREAFMAALGTLD